MNTKTKHRLLGIFVVIGLGIILFPLFQHEKSASPDVSLVKAPPFPDQSVQVTATEEKISPLEKEPEESNLLSNQPSVVNVKEEVIAEAPQTAPQKKNITPAKVETPKIVTAQVTPKLLPEKILQMPLDKNGLINLKGSVWVIQMGSFKNKTNAIRLVNQLRAHGYPAFIQQISSAFEEKTQVYVGPAKQRLTARTLADKIHQELNIHGIVISYKPLDL